MRRRDANPRRIKRSIRVRCRLGKRGDTTRDESAPERDWIQLSVMSSKPSRAVGNIIRRRTRLLVLLFPVVFVFFRD